MLHVWSTVSEHSKATERSLSASCLSGSSSSSLGTFLGGHPMITKITTQIHLLCLGNVLGPGGSHTHSLANANREGSIQLGSALALLENSQPSTTTKSGPVGSVRNSSTLCTWVASPAVRRRKGTFKTAGNVAWDWWSPA